MRCGFMINAKNGFDRSRLEFARELGCGCAELIVAPGCGLFPGDPDWKAKAAEVRGVFDDRNMRISCLAAFYVNHLDPEKAALGKKLVRGAIQLAEHMGIPVAAGFAGRVPNTELMDSVKPFAKLWSQHAKFADDHGIKIAFEHCPMGRYHMPAYGTNCVSTPGMWEACFNAVSSKALGLEWDPSHLICLFIDPVANLRKFGSRVYHVHAKDAHVNRDLLSQYGLWHPGVIEHCFPGLGDTDWGLVIKELLRQGYSSDLNVEGWHDQVYRDRGEFHREDTGLAISIRHLKQYVPDGME